MLPWKMCELIGKCIRNFEHAKFCERSIFWNLVKKIKLYGPSCPKVGGAQASPLTSCPTQVQYVRILAIDTHVISTQVIVKYDGAILTYK